MSYNFRTHIAIQMRETLGISRDDLSEKGQTQTINEVDRMDENNLLKALKDNDIFF